MDRQKLYRSVIVLLHACCFFTINAAFFFQLFIEWCTWYDARKSAGAYWKHVVLIPFFLFLCSLPVFLYVAGNRISVPDYVTIGYVVGFPITSLLILYLCGKIFPQEGSPPSWQAYVILLVSYPGWFFLFIFSMLIIHIEKFDHNL